jgi:DnaK suppressor protein
MFKDFNKEIEEQLIKQRDEIQSQLDKLGEHDNARNGFKVNFPKYGDKEDENADEVSAFGDRLSLGLNQEKALKEINETLAKIKNGTFGVCEKCGVKIDKKRLKAFPTAKYCLNCK